MNKDFKSPKDIEIKASPLAVNNVRQLDYYHRGDEYGECPKMCFIRLSLHRSNWLGNEFGQSEEHTENGNFEARA